MGLDNLTDRADETRTDEEHFNLFKRALSGDHVPRDSSGTTTDVAADLGSTSFGWVSFFIQTLKLRNSGFYSQLQAAASIASSFTAYLFSALPSKKAAIKIAADGTMLVPDPNAVLSGSSGSFSTTSASAVPATNLSQSITTRGNPVILMLVPDGVADAELRMTESAGARSVAALYTYFYRDLALVGLVVQRSDGADFATSPAHVIAMDFPPAGTYTYNIQASVTIIQNNGTSVVDSINLLNMKLVAMELF